ncbi:hypothetical protein ACFQX6_13740 [Streptosporangium lutulentum]
MRSATVDNNGETVVTKQEAAEAVRQAKVVTGVTWDQLAKAVGRPWRGPRQHCSASTR